MEEELKRLEYTLDEVENELNLVKRQMDKINRQSSSSRASFSGANENSQEYIELMINSILEESVKTKLKNLYAARSKPYFARIDFKEDEREIREKFYIGKVALIKEENQELVIVDWRAPVANLYYESRVGEAEYKSPSGLIKGNLYLKRQFSIEDGKLKDVFDIDITTNDEFLQKYLGANAENRLKDIVSTIQVEQNRVIRANMWKPLIVQGAAGSGKTTIALHRIAYLIYTYEKTFDPENFMIIAPSKFFLNYISDVLPELGVDKVKQTTFEEFISELLHMKLKIKDPAEKLMKFVNEDEADNEKIKEVSKIKSNLVFKEIIDVYIEVIEDKFIPKKDFCLGKIPILKYEEIEYLFKGQYRKMPIVKRIDQIKKHLKNRLNFKKEELINQIENKAYKTIKDLKENLSDTPMRKEQIINTIDKKNELIQKINKMSKVAVRDYIKNISKLNPYEYYKELICDKELFKCVCSAIKGVRGETLEYTRNYTENILNSGYVEVEDLAPIIYLKYKIHDIEEKISVKHIVIDEAQDFSPFQFYVLKKIIKDSSFTILGDLCQGINSYRGTCNWNDVRDMAFEGVDCDIVTLETSYRTTVEIMDSANEVIKKLNDTNLVLGKPVIRHGEEVKVLKMNSEEEIASDIWEKIISLESSGMKSMAIICKTLDECKSMGKIISKLSKRKSINIITGNEKEYKGGIVIIPSYLSKGLEFDVAFIADVSDNKYKIEEFDAKLLYVSMTRPLHKLYMYYINNISKLLHYA